MGYESSEFSNRRMLEMLQEKNNRLNITLLEDIELFERYLNENQPVLTNKAMHLAPKDCFALNQQMSRVEVVEKPTKRMGAYPYLTFIFELLLISELYVLEHDEKGKVRMRPTLKKQSFDLFSDVHKYSFLVDQYWRKGNFEGYSINKMLIFMTGLIQLENSEIDEILFNDEIEQGYMSGGFDILNAYVYFGWCTQDISLNGESVTFRATCLGKEVSRLVLKLGIMDWSYLYTAVIIHHLELKRLGEKSLYQGLKDLFDVKVELDKDLSHVEEESTCLDLEKRMYQLKINLTGRKWIRVYVSPKQTLADLHDAIMIHFDIEDDHLHEFNLSVNPKDRSCVYTGGPMGGGTDRVKLSGINLKKNQVFHYVFDYGMEVSFKLTVEDILPLQPKLKFPYLVLAKGI